MPGCHLLLLDVIRCHQATQPTHLHKDFLAGVQHQAHAAGLMQHVEVQRGMPLEAAALRASCIVVVGADRDVAVGANLARLCHKERHVLRRQYMKP
jgi:hypothetical protein